MKQKPILILTAVLSFAAGLCSRQQAHAGQPAPEPASRFDHAVRNDFFAGFTGDAAALERAMRTTSRVLAAQPDHAEALVWHGSGLFFQSGQFFRHGDSQRGMELWTKGLQMMDRAVELAPDHIGVRVPRGSTLLTTARFVPPDMAPQLVTRASADFTRTFELQRDRIAAMPEHPKGELLSALAEIHELQGRRDQSRAILEQIVRELAASPYARRASKWLAEGMPGPRERSCIGCHTASN